MTHPSRTPTAPIPVIDSLPLCAPERIPAVVEALLALPGDASLETKSAVIAEASGRTLAEVATCLFPVPAPGRFSDLIDAWVKATGRVDALTEGPAPNVVRYSLPIEIMHALDMMEPRIDAAPDDGIEPIDIEELRRLAGDDRVP